MHGGRVVTPPLHSETAGYNATTADDLPSLRPALFATGSGRVRLHDFQFRALSETCEMNTLSRRTMLMAAAALATSPSLARRGPQVQGGVFPKNFLWGAATSAYQVEGNNINSDVWMVENLPGTLYAERSGDAANSFALWPIDLDLLKGLGCNSYRFSLEWARIEPNAGYFSIAMLDHYKAIIEGCRARGLYPIVTFNHFTTPLWFAALDGWHNPQAPDLFARFCDRCARHFGPLIGHATTLNEPNLAGLLGEILPGDLLAGDRAMQEEAARRQGVARFTPGNALYVRDPAIFRAHQMEAHRKGVAAIKAVRADLPVGVSLAIMDDQAVGADSIRDAMRERYYGEWLRLTAETCDFVGVQNYERKVWDAKGPVPASTGAPRNSMGAELWPGSLSGAVRYAFSVTQLPVLVTEHGVCTDDDSVRIWFLTSALSELKRAIDDGVPVQGYWHWSMVDNFEWGFGYKYRFGLYELDRTTFKRTAKPSASVFGRIARHNRVVA